MHLIYLTSADVILRDYQNNIIDRTQLPLLFNISGKVKQSIRHKKAQKRAMRGASTQQHSNYLSSHLDNPLTPDTHTDAVAPGTFPEVSLSVNPSAWDVDNGTVQEWLSSHVEVPVGDNRQTSNSVLCLFSPPLTSFDLRQHRSTALLGRHYARIPSGCRSLLLEHCVCAC